jgi:hypothetical protein
MFPTGYAAQRHGRNTPCASAAAYSDGLDGGSVEVVAGGSVRFILRRRRWRSS